MKKNIKSSSVINAINEISMIAKDRGIAHLFTQDSLFDGRQITIRNQTMINFGSCSYLGLETDQRIKDSGIEAIQRYGSQFSCSRTYVSFTLYEELEELLGKMFQAPLLLSTCSTMGHMAVIPIIIDDEDAVILDHQAHISMQDASKRLQLNGIPVTMLRHSRIDELEMKVQELSLKHEKIWYFIDGVYSMYGDFAPIDKITALMEKYPKLWLYADDAHGMSWAGENGKGYLLSKTKLHPRMVLATSLAKGFASAGGVFLFPNTELRDRVKNWGGPLTYSGPQQPAVIGASIASAKIHLSSEIYYRQTELRERIQFCNETIRKYNLPLIAETDGPIFFIGLGLTKVGYNMVKRLANDGLYVNLGIFPAVPETCTGIRFTITLQHRFEDIENLINRIAYHLPLAFKEEGRTMEDVYRGFKSITKFESFSDLKKEKPQPSFHIEKYNTISSIQKELWDSLMKNRGAFNHDILELFEEVYKNNTQQEDNWEFYYYLVKDRNDKVIAATFFTLALCKEDMFAPPSVSAQIEEMRKDNKYYLSAKYLMMGSLLSEGDHLYVNRAEPDWKGALMILLDEVWQQQEKNKAEFLYIRDFDLNDAELKSFFMDQGFVKMEISSSHIFDKFNWNNREEYLSQLPGKKRNRIKREVLKFENCFDIKFVEQASESEIEHWYNLYKNIKSKNLAVNLFDIPKKLFFQMANNPDWDIIQLSLKSDLDQREEKAPIAIGFIYKSYPNYYPLIIGIDHSFKEFNTYRQMLFQAILRAKELKMEKIHFGLTATEDKQKFGIKPMPKVVYFQQRDSYNSQLINLIPQLEKVRKAS
jgi:7-keto-8-aminopelargonate synthetase-like enzyme/predicted N-acyltransferase